MTRQSMWWPFHFRGDTINHGFIMEHFDLICLIMSMQWLHLLSTKMSYGTISQNLEATRYRFRIIRLSWHLTGASAAEATVKFQNDTIILPPNLMAWDFARSYKTSCCLLNKTSYATQEELIWKYNAKVFFIYFITFYVKTYSANRCKKTPVYV